ncbi:MAG: hypothetical protein FJ318_04955 [SAR202 cluster bacterium]|nr:hypothetical protein [SAR202 cluster bacterium]
MWEFFSKPQNGAKMETIDANVGGALVTRFSVNPDYVKNLRMVTATEGERKARVTRVPLVHPEAVEKAKVAPSYAALDARRDLVWYEGQYQRPEDIVLKPVSAPANVASLR